MKIAVGAVSHETNTFATGRTRIEMFSTATGTDLLKTDAVGRSLGGIVETLESEGVDIHPTVGASALPSATVEWDAFEWMKSTLLTKLEDEVVDGVCLDLHGSMFVEGEPDPEGELLSAVREIVGLDVPITAALDMHATITEQMVEQLDGVAGYRTAPHTDVTETGRRAAKLLLADVRGEVSLMLGWERLPMLLAGERSESEAEPMCTLVRTLHDADERDGIYDANYFLGFPWADTPYAGCHSLVTGDAKAANTVAETATDLASEFWRQHDEFDFTTETHVPSAALDEAATNERRPVVVADTGDIPGAGAAQNTTNLLSAILERSDLGTPLVAIISDVNSYEHCCAVNEGETISLSLGCSVPDETSLSVTGTVTKRLEIDGVGTALISLTDGADVIIADERTNLHRDPEFIRQLGIDPIERDVVILKSGYLSPAWKDIAARRLFALTSGDTNQRLAELPYRRVPRPMSPLDEDVEWST